MWSMEYDTGTTSGRYSWGDNDVSFYKTSEHPTHFDFTFDEVERLGHDAGTAGTHWYLTVEKDLGNGRTREFHGIGLHVSNWLKMARRDIERARNGLPPQRYLAQRAKNTWWVNPKLCNPVIDSSQYSATQKANQKKMVA